MKNLEIKRIGKYEIVSLLGEGGISYVYKAYDPVLKRYVALKVLKVADPVLIKRFFKEARAQGSLENENVCKIYEFGEEDNIPYISMQYINGIPLGEAVKDLNLEKKLIIIKKICDALKEAHKKGFIHRDIKPSNILVEFKEEGEIKPYIIDFGLVKEVEKSDFSFPGLILGTIGFMSPEQLKGKLEEIDRRTDIYSIGAVLYTIFSGKYPFKSDDLVEYEKELEEGAVPLRKIKKDLPKDLEAIVMKCLEREKIKRYQSINELSEDIERFLNGEPVKAKSPNLIYKILKKVKKHKNIFYFSLIIFFLILSFSIYLLHIKNIERKQRTLSLEYSQQIKYLEDVLWYTYSASVHNIKPQMDFVKEKLKEFEKSFKSGGNYSLGPAHYSIAKGYIALGDFKKAKENLEIAQIKYNFNPSDLNYLLCFSNIMVYFEGESKILNIEDINLRKKALIKLEEDYLKKAEDYILKSKRGDIETWEFLEAMDFFIKKEYEKSLKKIEETKLKFPWYFENYKLEAKIYKSIGDNASIKGNKEEAMENYLKAENVLKEILKLRESDPDVYKLLSMVYLSIMDMFIYQSSETPEELFEKIIDCSDKLFKLNINLEETFSILSYANLKMGSFYLYEGKNPEIYFENSVIYAKKVIQINERDPRGYSLLGSSHLSKGAYLLSIYKDPSFDFLESIKNYKKAMELNPKDLNVLNNLSLALWNKGIYEERTGKDPENSFKEGINFIKKAIKIEGENPTFYNTRGNLYLEYYYSKSRRGEEKEELLSFAIKSFEKAIEKNPNYAFPYNNLTECYILKLEKEIEDEKSFKEDLKKARAYVKKALNLKADFIWSYISATRLEIIEAKYKIKRGLNPKDNFERGFEVIKKGEKIEKDSIPLKELKKELINLSEEFKL